MSTLETSEASELFRGSQGPAPRATLADTLRPFLLAASALISACDGGGAAPKATGDQAPYPISISGIQYRAMPQSVTSSSTAFGYSESNVTAYDHAGGDWRAAAEAPQWLEFDLGQARVVREVRLKLAAGVAADGRHRILAGLAAAATPIGTLEPRDLVAGTYSLVLPQPLAGIRFLRVETLAGSGVPGWSRVEVHAQSTMRPQWFGYYGDAFSGLTPVAASVQDHISVTWISAAADDLSHFESNLVRATGAGILAALALPQDIFFDDDLSLRPDRQQRWNALAALLATHAEHIAFVLPVDEPYSQARVLGVDPLQMRERLENVAQMIRISLPATKIALSFSWMDFGATGAAFFDLANPLPYGYDLFGFDCYGSWDTCGESNYGPPRSIPWYVQQIVARLGADQRLFLFADGFARQPLAGPSVGAEESERLLNAADRFFDLALNEPAIAGLFVFLFQDDYVEGTERFLGVSHWPAVADRWRAVGAALKGW